MDVSTLTAFFGWCSLINGALLLWSSFWILVAPDLTYRIQSWFFKLSRETFDSSIYGLLGVFKILFLVFNLVPWIALTIIT